MGSRHQQPGPSTTCAHLHTDHVARWKEPECTGATPSPPGPDLSARTHHSPHTGHWKPPNGQTPTAQSKVSHRITNSRTWHMTTRQLQRVGPQAVHAALTPTTELSLPQSGHPPARTGLGPMTFTLPGFAFRMWLFLISY